MVIPSYFMFLSSFICFYICNTILSYNIYYYLLHFCHLWSLPIFCLLNWSTLSLSYEMYYINKLDLTCWKKLFWAFKFWIQSSGSFINDTVRLLSSLFWNIFMFQSHLFLTSLFYFIFWGSVTKIVLSKNSHHIRATPLHNFRSSTLW